MFIAQRILGYAALLMGLYMALFGALIEGAAFAAAGFVLVSLAELVRLQQGMYHLALGLPLKNEQIHKILRRTPPVKVTSTTLSIHPFNETEYPLLELQGESYLRVKAFIPYIEQSETEYRFTFPESALVLLICDPRYSQGSRLFQYNDQVFVKLSALPLSVQKEGDRLRVEIAAPKH
ncbi:hypothetical protein PghCCS26_38000 [Paenibacillus glycanilyticus]|uniref:DUF58 domain-containing protein n=1 Tax=Paenibacillus glycanilyticus TaxID=126569 RepID=A0ABQ6NNJ2_9BACL|nr:hypothetical protein [Paenibacillus glycanilyticus]GMK46671.1 hypothetical protein PghCCS26_38000 [Paenibacillus glycanilyticus]